MQSVEDLGFSVMASYEAKLTMAEGVVLGAGAVLALAASHMASKSLAESEAKRDTTSRFMDRLAQEDPEWAISKYPDEYERGMRIAPFVEQAARYVRDLSAKGEQVVIHGRDGEIIYRAAQRLPGTNMKKVHYAITSRPLTMSRFGYSSAEESMSTPMPEKYGSYLARMIPKNAVHIDTAFSGRVPRFLNKIGFQVKSIKMIAAEREEDEIPFTGPLANMGRGEYFGHFIIDEAEDSAQRLKEVPGGSRKKDSAEEFGNLEYSPDAPGFWSRLYAICDFMGVPRKLDVPSYERRS